MLCKVESVLTTIVMMMAIASLIMICIIIVAFVDCIFDKLEKVQTKSNKI